VFEAEGADSASKRAERMEASWRVRLVAEDIFGRKEGGSLGFLFKMI